MDTPFVKFRRAKETSFLVLDEVIFDLFSPYALKVYGQLRKLVSYNKESDDIAITVKNLAHLSGISERKTFDILNELEHTHYIIKRTNLYHFRYGQMNSFVVSQTYGIFKPDQESHTPAQYAEGVDNCVQKLTTPAQYAEGTAQYAEGTAQYADLSKQELLQEVSKKKQKQEIVFSDEDSIKNHISLIVSEREVYVEDDIMNQIVWYVGKSRAYKDVIKKINIGLKKVREGKWNIPNGYKGITYQSICKKEQDYENDKIIQYEQDSFIFKEIVETIQTREPYKKLADRLKDKCG